MRAICNERFGEIRGDLPSREETFATNLALLAILGGMLDWKEHELARSSCTKTQRAEGFSNKCKYGLVAH